MASTNSFDAIVIGSGISGGWAAKEMTDKGLRVLMLDRGVMVEHGSGYPYDGTPDFQLPARGTVPPAIVESDYFIAKYGYLSTSNLQFYNDDRSEEHTSELQSLMRISYAVFCLKTKNI